MKTTLKNHNTKQAIHNKQKGITLIALVITIIVLLILAGVAINLALDANGLFSRANEAKTEWNNRVEQEGETINGLLNQLDELVPPTDAKTLVELFDEGELQIGDYVNYSPIATGDTGEEEKYRYESLETQNGYSYQEFQVEPNTKWRILGVEEDEVSGKRCLLIISESSIGEFELHGEVGYLNGITELDNISAIYGNGDGALRARSMMLDDFNTITKLMVDNPDYYDNLYGLVYGLDRLLVGDALLMDES